MVMEFTQETAHLSVYVLAIGNCFPDGRPRSCTALWPRYSFPKSLVVRIEIVEKLRGVDFIAGLVLFEQRLKEPGRVADVPTWRTHKFGRLNHIVFNLQR